MNVLGDFRYASRSLLRKPGFTLISLTTLALVLGANTAIFTVVNAVMLRPLSYPEAEELVQLRRAFQDEYAPTVAIPKYLFWRGHNRVFESMTAYDTLGSGFNLTGDGAPERITGSRVSHNFFKVFGIRPEIGRDFLPEEDRPNVQKVVILSHSLWNRRFGGDPSILGRPVTLNGEPYVVKGIMPAFFRFPAIAELWTPIGIDPASREKANYLEVTGRLKEGMTLEKGQAEMKVVAEQYGKAWPDEMIENETVSLCTLREHLYGGLRPALLVMQGTVGLVLLMACVNIANLQLARVGARRREIAIRAALGAGSTRIIRLLLTESLVLSLAGGLLGLLLGAWTLRPLLTLGRVYREGGGQSADIDSTVLLFALVLSLLSCVLFGLVPALQAARPNLNDPLKEDLVRSTGDRASQFTRIGLVVVEMAVALLVITGAALLVRSFVELTSRDPGFDPTNVVTMKMSLPEDRYANPRALEAFSREINERIDGLPGVHSATVANALPLELGPDLPFTIEGKYDGGDEGIGYGQYRVLTPEYFETLRIPLVRGTPFSPVATGNGELVAIINETAASRYWPGEDPVGAFITLGQPHVPELADPAPRRIVGIVKNVREQGLDKGAPAIVYVPIGQINPAVAALLVRLLPFSVAVRTERAPLGIVQPIQREIWAVDPLQPIHHVELMEATVDRSLGGHRFNMVLLAALASLALLLAAVGLYGVLSYLVGQRTREIGVRMALGATPRQVLIMVVRQALVATAIGMVLGLGLVLMSTRALSSLLVGVSTIDPLTFAVAVSFLALVSVIATLVPARRASQLDPLVALRHE